MTHSVPPRRASDLSDVAVAMVERAVLLARYPESQRTWLKFRGGWWSGANLFRLRGRRVLPLLEVWGRIERDRKKGLKIVAAFGPALLLAVVLRLEIGRASGRERGCPYV